MCGEYQGQINEAVGAKMIKRVHVISGVEYRMSYRPSELYRPILESLKGKHACFYYYHLFPGLPKIYLFLIEHEGRQLISREDAVEGYMLFSDGASAQFGRWVFFGLIMRTLYLFFQFYRKDKVVRWAVSS